MAKVTFRSLPDGGVCRIAGCRVDWRRRIFRSHSQRPYSGAATLGFRGSAQFFWRTWGASYLFYCYFVRILSTMSCSVVWFCFKKVSGLDVGFVFASSSSQRVVILFEALSMHLFLLLLYWFHPLISMINEIFFAVQNKKKKQKKRSRSRLSIHVFSYPAVWYSFARKNGKCVTPYLSLIGFLVVRL